MPTECSATLFEFAPVEGRSVVGAFDGGKITSDAGGFLLAATDRAVGLIDRFAGCFTDRRSPELVEPGLAAAMEGHWILLASQFASRPLLLSSLWGSYVFDLIGSGRGI